MTYWLDLFTGITWEEFRKAGSQVSGFLETRWTTVQKIKEGDIYSGVLHMSDLTAMQPNLNKPLYLVAPDDRRDKVFTEINRPTFSRLSPRLSDTCGFISFSDLKHKLEDVGSYLRFLKPEFLEELSEECSLGED